MPCSSDIEADCQKKNMYSNWTVGNAYCSFEERCTGGTRCCNASCPIKGCNKTCKGETKTGINCKGYNPSDCGCTGSGGSHPVSRLCEFYCFYPPTDKYCYPGSTSVAYISGSKDKNDDNDYVFKATYNTSLFTTPAQVKTLEDTLKNNNITILDKYSQYETSNTTQLNILKKKVCTSSNLFTDPCVEYCKPDISGVVPTSNCADAWKTFCAYSDNIGSAECGDWCLINSSGNSNCDYLTYCDNSTNFTKSACKDFYDTQYVNNKLSDSVVSLLKKQCSKYADANGNIIGSDGVIVQAGATSDKYPVATCACFLPDNVYSTFYDTSTKDYPELRKFFTVNQCSYPDCANTVATQPQKMTCPDVAVTSCIVNNTIGGNVTNSNFNIVNACITEVQETGTYTNNNTNVASPTDTTAREKVAAVIPPETTETTEPTYFSTTDKNTLQIIVGVLAVMFFFMFIMFVSKISQTPTQPEQSSSRNTTIFILFIGMVATVALLVVVAKKMRE
jgi:hypothetical protein